MKLPPPLLALTPGDLPRRGARALREAIQVAVEAGLRGVLVREPDCEDGPLLAFLEDLAARLGTDAGLWLGLHDRAHLALALRLDGLHLGHRSLPPEAARRVFGVGAIGLSTHAGDERATWAAADYLFHGPLHDTPSKRGLVAPLGLARLGEAGRSSPRPMWALGGVRPEDAGPLRRAGLAGLAVLSGVLGAEDPGAATRAYLEAWEAAA